MKVRVYDVTKKHHLNLEISVKYNYSRKMLRRIIRRELGRSRIRPMPIGQIDIFYYNSVMKKNVSLGNFTKCVNLLITGECVRLLEE